MPDGQSDWKPHERSMAFGYLARLVATMPSWVALGARVPAIYGPSADDQRF